MLRRIVSVLAILEGLVVVVAVIGGFVTESDPAGEGMAMGVAVLAGIAGLVLVLPAYLTARSNRYLWLGLALVILPLVPFVLLLV